MEKRPTPTFFFSEPCLTPYLPNIVFFSTYMFSGWFLEPKHSFYHMVGHQQWPHPHWIWVLCFVGGKCFHAGEEWHVLMGVRQLKGCFVGLLLQSMNLLSTNVLCCIIFLLFLYHLHWINSRDVNEFKWLSNSQYSNYSNWNTSWTPGEPSKVPLGMSTTTSAIKIGMVIIFSAFGQTPPLWPLVQDPCSTTPLRPIGILKNKKTT